MNNRNRLIIKKRDTDAEDDQTIGNAGNQEERQ